MRKKFNFGRFLAGKGYYIALILCAVAIGISGYMYYLAANQPDTPEPDGNQNVLAPGDDIQAGATLPGGATKPGTNPTEPVKRPYPIGRPLSGETTKDYAMDCLSYNETTRDWRVHNGIDIAADAGTAVKAAAAGTVYSVFKDETMGYTVVIRHDGGYVTKYASLDENVKVKAGDTVQMGDTIGAVANTALLESAQGDHLHFSVTFNDVPMDPASFLAMN
ncbi:MAG: M23 family metallopeptidase [Ruminococcaceae bacterium]|nr:M23 family metallopeptidase [Oscillospiraceae bacterium]